jgi:uncharacterized LabA/DUF88 family protein
MSEDRLKLAVFIDFDNIEIGVKTTLSRRFDVGTVLEAIKERGEVVTKIAYGNWRMAEDYSRAMTEHAVQMVQRNVTPGGDKNGADINLALDALEMAFTRDHINAFVIVGGDSDFIALVEKLKQYDKKVMIVGGRAFTSAILQKNCHEFIAYENLIGAQTGSRKVPGRPPVRSQLERAFPLVRRALKVLADREVSPQLGLLKSTLLQLDSTFSERDYGAGTFREFIQKMANAGLVSLKQVDRSLIVEARESETPASTSSATSAPAEESAPEAVEEAAPESAPEPTPAPWAGGETAAPSPAGNGIPGLLHLIREARTQPKWPMYLRTLRQYLRVLDPSFDERKLGFSGLHDLLRQAQRESVFRVDRNRHGVIRIFAGERYPQTGAATATADLHPDYGASDAAEPGLVPETPARMLSELFGDAPSEQPGVLEAEPHVGSMEESEQFGEPSTETQPEEVGQAETLAPEQPPLVAEEPDGTAEPEPEAKPRRRARSASRSATAPKKAATTRRLRTGRKPGRTVRVE